ncbi:MAG: hypothetical protein LWY06_05020 [Firmicutes bacterium]|nr:hypothetical protein [Bacillota bacterium]
MDGTVSISSSAVCPHCRNKSAPAGSYVAVQVPVPVKVRVLFFNVALSINTEINYCPACGYLKVNAAQK